MTASTSIRRDELVHVDSTDQCLDVDSTDEFVDVDSTDQLVHVDAIDDVADIDGVDDRLNERADDHVHHAPGHAAHAACLDLLLRG